MNVPIRVFKHTDDYVIIGIGKMTHICRIQKCAAVIEGDSQEPAGAVSPDKHEPTLSDECASKLSKCHD
jgi:hypothetical protein